MNLLLRYVVVLVIGAAGGYLYATSPVDDHVANDSLTESSHTHYEMYEVPASVAIPSVNLVAHEDSVGGWNLNITTQNFRFAPEHAGEENTPGEGHAHLFVDDLKVGRVYGNWFHLGALPEGEHTIMVTLNTNDHAQYTVGGETIAASVTVVVHPKKETETMEATGETKTLDLVVKNRELVSGSETLSVKQGDIVVITITADEDEELHVHGYDTSVELKAGEKATLTFVANASGRFPFELENSKTDIGALEVQP